jgi:DNA-binding winged helix-turn-helix (wHTH) protein
LNDYFRAAVGNEAILKILRNLSETEQMRGEHGMPITYRFGPFRLDGETMVLSRGSEPTDLGRRAAALLQVLLERPRDLVSKQELVAAVWSGLAVQESNLSVQVAALRRVLRDEPGAARWIETRPSRGYRYIGPEVTKHRSEGAPVRDASADRRNQPAQALDEPPPPTVHPPAVPSVLPAVPPLQWPSGSTAWSDVLGLIGDAGVVIVDANSRPLFVNRAAEALLKQGDGLRIDCQGLCALDAQETSSIRRLIAATDQDQIRISAAPLLVSRRCARSPLAILVVPMRASPGSVSQRAPAAIVFITNSDQAAPPAARIERCNGSPK